MTLCKVSVLPNNTKYLLPSCYLINLSVSLKVRPKCLEAMNVFYEML